MKHPWKPTKDTVRVLILLTNSLTAPPSAVNMDSSNIDNMTPLQKHQDNQETFINFHPKEPRYTSLKHPFCRQGTPVRPHFFEAHEHLQGHWAALKLNPPCVGRQGTWTGVESAVCSGATIAIMWEYWGFSVWHIGIALVFAWSWCISRCQLSEVPVLDEWNYVSLPSRSWNRQIQSHLDIDTVDKQHLYSSSPVGM